MYPACPPVPTAICPLHHSVASMQREAGSDRTYCTWPETENNNTLTTQKGKSAWVNTNLQLRISLFPSLSLCFKSSYCKFCFLYNVLCRSKDVLMKIRRPLKKSSTTDDEKCNTIKHRDGWQIFKVTKHVLCCFIILVLYYLMAQKMSYFSSRYWYPTGISST